ncbi:MAG TPA: glycosyltransferase family 2 protein [Gemmatimonadaceae bacterium]
MSEKVAPRTSTARRLSVAATCDVVTVVVNYGTPRLTIDCVESVLTSTGVVSHVLVVDNASPDDSVDQLRAKFADDPRVTIVARPSNDGYTGGNNAGVRVAREMGARYAFLLNSDATVDPQCIEALVDAAERDATIALVNPRILIGGTDELWFGGARYSPWLGRPAHEVQRHRSLVARDLEFATGCALLVRLDALSGPNSDLFDASLFAYAEDLDLSRRVRGAERRIRYVPRALVSHFAGSSHADAGGRALRFYLSTRNQLRVATRHARWYHWVTLGPMLAIDVVARFAAVTLRDGNPAAFRAVLRGALHALTGGRHRIEAATRQ